MGPTWPTKHRISHGWHLVMSWTQPGKKQHGSRKTEAKDMFLNPRGSPTKPTKQQKKCRSKWASLPFIYFLSNSSRPYGQFSSDFDYANFSVTARSPFGNRKCVCVDYAVGFQKENANPYVVWSTWNQLSVHIFDSGKYHIRPNVTWQIQIRRRLQSPACQVIPRGVSTKCIVWPRGRDKSPFRFSNLISHG